MKVDDTMDLGEGFTPYNGKVREKMPELKAAKETPISFDFALQRQITYPETWGQISISTGDAILRDREGNGVISKASALLYDINIKSKLQNGALVIKDAQYGAVRYGPGVVHLSKEEIAKANGKGYVKKDGVWRPYNTTVGYIWEILTNKRDLKDHAELAFQKSGAQEVMCLYFDQRQRKQPTLRAWCVNNLDYGSDAYGNTNLDYDNGILVGVAPEALERRLK